MLIHFWKLSVVLQNIVALQKYFCVHTLEQLAPSHKKVEELRLGPSHNGRTQVCPTTLTTTTGTMVEPLLFAIILQNISEEELRVALCYNARARLCSSALTTTSAGARVGVMPGDVPTISVSALRCPRTPQYQYSW